MDDLPIAEAAHQVARGKGYFWGGVGQNLVAVVVVGWAKPGFISRCSVNKINEL